MKYLGGLNFAVTWVPYEESNCPYCARRASDPQAWVPREHGYYQRKVVPWGHWYVLRKGNVYTKPATAEEINSEMILEAIKGENK